MEGELLDTAGDRCIDDHVANGCQVEQRLRSPAAEAIDGGVAGSPRRVMSFPLRNITRYSAQRRDGCGS